MPAASGLTRIRPDATNGRSSRRTARHFVARAWANLDDDPQLDIWEITDGDAFRPLHVFDDKKDIGYRIEPRSTERWRPVDGYFKPPVSDER